MAIDFAAIKEAVSLEQAKDYLGLTMKFVGGQFRSSCPTCKAGGDRALAITPNKGFYCFHIKRGGDVIALVSHIRGCSQREAAAELQERFMRELPKHRPASTATTHHPVFDALGLSEAVCKQLGITYSETHGRVMFPLRLPDGTSVGEMGLATTGDQAPLITFDVSLDQPEAKPADNIVDFKKFFRVA